MTSDEHQNTEVIWGGRIMGAKMRAETASEEARKAARAADHALGLHGRLWRPGPAVPNPRPMPERRLGRLEIECCRCKTRSSSPLDAIRRARETPIWKLVPEIIGPRTGL